MDSKAATTQYPADVFFHYVHTIGGETISIRGDRDGNIIDVSRSGSDVPKPQPTVTESAKTRPVHHIPYYDTIKKENGIISFDCNGNIIGTSRSDSDVSKSQPTVPEATKAPVETTPESIKVPTVDYNSQYPPTLRVHPVEDMKIPTINIAREERCVAYKETFRNENLLYYGVCYQVWFLLKFVDPKWATPEHYSTFGTFLLRDYKAPDLFLYFVRKHAPLECLDTMTRLAQDLVERSIAKKWGTNIIPFNPYAFMSFLIPGTEAEYLRTMTRLIEPSPLTESIETEDLVKLFQEAKGETYLERIIDLVPKLRGKMLVGENYLQTKNGYIHTRTDFSIYWKLNGSFGQNALLMIKKIDCLQAPPLPERTMRLNHYMSLIKSGQLSKGSKSNHVYNSVKDDYLTWTKDMGVLSDVSLDIVHLRNMFEQRPGLFFY